MRHIGLGFALVSLLALSGCGGDDGAGGGNAGTGNVSGQGGSATGGNGGSGTGGSGTGGSATGGTGGSGGGTGGSVGLPTCDPLPAPTGTTVDVTPGDAGNLHSMIQSAGPNTTFVLADGTYAISSTLQLSKAGVSLRSASNDAQKVVIDGQYQVNELVAVSASDVTIADITFTHAVDHAIHAYPPSENVDVKNLTVYRARLVDNGEQFIKINNIAGQPGYIDDGRVECSEFLLTDAGRPHIETAVSGCYTGGIDAHNAWNWVVRKNRFEGIYCETGLAEHAIHFWKGSRDTLVENNVILDCARGIGFGLGGGAGERQYPDNPYGGEMLAHFDGIIRNNVVWANIPFYDTGIEIDEAKTPKVFHNTVVSGTGATNMFSAIDARFASTITVIQNNLTDKITQRDGAQATLGNNLESTPLGDFVSAGSDFHLVPGASDAIDQGMQVSDPGLDIDGDAHDTGAPDIGCDEFKP